MNSSGQGTLLNPIDTWAKQEGGIGVTNVEHVAEQSKQMEKCVSTMGMHLGCEAQEGN